MISEGSESERPWRELEPQEQTDAVEHRICTSLSHDGWLLLAASTRGKRHAYFAEWRDDSYAVTCVDPWTIVAVADGAGSARLSRLGSKIASDTVIERLSEALMGIAVRLEVWGGEPVCPQQDEVKRAFVEALLAARRMVLCEADRRQCPARDLHTTLLVLAHARIDEFDVVFWIGVGDCVAALFRNDGECQILSDEDHGSAEGETRFLTTPGIETDLERRAGCGFFRAPNRALALMTDGVADDFFPLKARLRNLLNGDPIGDRKMLRPDGAPLKGILHYVSCAAPDPSSALLDWLQYDKLGSFDDRTMVLLLSSES